MTPVVGFQTPKLAAMNFVDALHAEYSPALRRYFRGNRLSDADAQDLTQDVFLRLSQSTSSMRLRDPAAFVFTLAQNLIRDRSRRASTRAARHSVDVHSLQLPCERMSPERQLELEETVMEVEDLLSRLNPRARLAFLQSRVDGDSYAHIASTMGVSVSTIEKYIIAALKVLKGTALAGIRAS
ncbi:MAG: sigma-70 family RNA polymerase sigma factor [Proteobacteria bacterium]|nr:sigma-70 family RNA polymerase sigma factor [Pseudomonadota bacterium]